MLSRLQDLENGTAFQHKCTSVTQSKSKLKTTYSPYYD